MTTDTDLIAYLEAQRRRRTIILGWVLAAGLVLGGIGFAIKSAADANHHADCEVREYTGNPC